jgi:citrate synthase
VKDKNSNVRLMGFGHRVYKNYDPRAKIMQKTAMEVLDQLGLKSKIRCCRWRRNWKKWRCRMTTSFRRKLYPNVDFYSGIILRAMGFPLSMFTVLFALARTVGWISQWKEMIEEPNQKIGRPRQLYTGPTRRDYVPMNSRG